VTTTSGTPNTALPMPMALVGMGCLFPKANDLGAYWANIKNGVDAITALPDTHWSPDDYFDGDPKRPDFTYGNRGGFLEPVDFDPLAFGITPNAIEATDTSQLLGMLAADRALRDAGYGPEATFDRDRVSVILGVTGALELVIPLGARLSHPLWRKALRDAGVDDATAEDVVARIAEGYVPWQENSFPGLLGNVVAGRISKYLNLGGTNCVVDAACASSFSAIHLAALELASGRTDMVVTGGVDTFSDIFMYMCFSKTPALSRSGDARPFSADADGTMLGEGLGLVVLKRLADAERDGDRIYAVLKGMGTSSDGKGDAIYAPSPKGQVKALRRAYATTGVTPNDIELLEAHGTGTMAGDAAELKALKEVYGDAQGKPWCALGSVKSQIGHTKAAAGAAGLIKAALALYTKTLPPTIKVSEPAPTLRGEDVPFYVNTEKRPWLPRPDYPRRAAISAFGFGGSNFHCVLEEHAAEKPAPDWDGDVELVALSGATAQDVERELAPLAEQPDWEAVQTFARVSRSVFRADAASRLALVVERGDALPSVVEFARKALREGTPGPGAAYAGQGAHEGKVSFIFPGQGAQYVGMLRDLACQFPEMLASLSLADAATASDPVSQRIYPHPAFDKESRAAQEAALTRTDTAQPALGAVSAGAAKILQRFGVRPDASAGHSYGELPALHVAGRFDEEALYRISRKRGELMAAGVGDKGGMLAVRAPLETVAQVLEEAKLDLVIANRNAPDQAVLSGATDEIERAVGVMKEKKLRCVPLQVAAAFHSPLVADARKPLLETLEGVAFASGAFPVFANTTAEAYPDDESDARALLAGQLAQPVEFTREIENLHAAGVRTFVEVGPGARMCGLIKSILGDRPHAALALDASSGKRNGIADLARLLAQLAALGVIIDLTPWNAERFGTAKPAPSAKKRMTVPICGANYRAPFEKRPPAQKRPAAAPAPIESQPAARQAAVPQPQAAPLSVVSQDSLIALQQLQQQTAELHRQFLEGQQAAMATFQTLLGQPPAAFPATAVSTVQPMPAPAPPVAPQPAPSVAVAPAPEPAPAPTAAPVSGRITEVLLAVIAEKTGYPVDMLDLDMSLDADLGIDSIKRVEILSALKEQLPDAPEIEARHLGELQTLHQIVDHLTATMPTQVLEAIASVDTGRAEKVLLATVAEKTGYPVDMLDLGMSLDADLGIDSIKRVEILSTLKEQLPDAPEIEAQHLGELQTLGQIIEHLASGMAPAAGATAAPAPSDGPVRDVLLAVIAEKTGYPVDMLDLDMSLDADLGIDSIKRVEILSTLKEQLPDAPEIEAQHLGELQTLGQIVDHLTSGTAASVSPAAVSAPLASRTQEVLLAVIAEKTGYPVDMLDLDMSLDADLGIDSIKRVEILSTLKEQLPDAPEIEAQHLGELQTLGQIVEHLATGAAVNEPTPPVLAPAPAPEPEVAGASGILRQVLRCTPCAARKDNAVVVTKSAPLCVLRDDTGLAEALTAELCAMGYAAEAVAPDAEASNVPASLAGLIVLSPRNAYPGNFARTAFQWVQRVSSSLRETGRHGGALLATVSRLDGRFGLSGKAGDLEPRSGGLAGLAKTARHEWPEVTCKAIDLASDFADDREAAKALVRALFEAEPAELGISREGRWQLTLEDEPLPEEAGELPFSPGDAVVVSGGARGVTAEVAVALAEAAQPTLVLLGRSAPPKEEPAWLKPLTSEAAVKQAIVQHGEGDKTPKAVGEACRAALANREMLRTMARIEAAGGSARYLQVDIRDAAAVAKALSEVRASSGPVRGLIHGAGVIADRRIEDKTSEQFDRVCGTKVDGLASLLAAMSDDDLKAIVLFSSSTGRFGRTGQVDYAVANEVLNKIAQAESARRKDCRVVAVNWGPWAGGMVTPALAKLFADEGIELIGLKAGAEYLLREIAAGTDAPAEVVILGKTEADAPLEEPATPPAKAPKRQPSPALELAFEADVNVEDYPFLASHVLNHRAVLPAAMMVEWFGHGALHANPGLRFHGVDGLRVTKGVILEPGASRKVGLYSGKTSERDGEFVAPVELRGLDDGLLHASGEVVLVNALPEGTRALRETALKRGVYDNGGLYGTGHLFHGPEFQALDGVDGNDEDLIAGQAKVAPAPTAWMKHPMRNRWLADPLALDSSFQLLILWSFGKYGVGSLPTLIGRYRQYRTYFPKGGVRVVAQVCEHTKRRAISDIEFIDPATDALVARLEGYECTLAASLNEAFKKNTLEVPAKP